VGDLDAADQEASGGQSLGREGKKQETKEKDTLFHSSNAVQSRSSRGGTFKSREEGSKKPSTEKG